MRETGNNERISSFDRKGEQKHGTVSKGEGWDQERNFFLMGRAITCFFALGDDVVKRGKSTCQEGKKCQNKEEGIESNVRREGLASGRRRDNSSLAAGGKAERRKGNRCSGTVDAVEGAWARRGRSPLKDSLFSVEYRTKKSAENED